MAMFILCMINSRILVSDYSVSRTDVIHSCNTAMAKQNSTVTKSNINARCFHYIMYARSPTSSQSLLLTSSYQKYISRSSFLQDIGDVDTKKTVEGENIHFSIYKIEKCSTFQDYS